MSTFFDIALEKVRNAVGSQFRGNVSEAARAWGVKQATLYSWLADGKSRRVPTLDTLSPVLDILGATVMLPSELALIQRTGANAPIETVSQHDSELPKVPIVGEAGAGREIENFFSSEEEQYCITVPRDYHHQGVRAFRVSGDSMEPKIPAGSYVGVVPFRGNLREGGIYLVYLPPFGFVVKRVFMNEDGNIVLVSENPAYGKRVISYEGYENIIQGSVVWILQKSNE